MAQSPKLTYVRVGGRLQLLERLTPEQQETILSGEVEMVHEVGEDGAITEDVKRGRVRRDGRDAPDHPGLLAAARQRVADRIRKGGAPGGSQRR